MMKCVTLGAILLALGAFLGGCAQTVSPEKFLYTYRLSAPPGQMEQGWEAQYTGHDDQYRYLTVRYSTLDRGAEQILKYGAFREEVLRCPLVLLPRDFPDGFEQLYREGRRTEPEADTYDYIRRYLRGPASKPGGEQRVPPGGG